MLKELAEVAFGAAGHAYVEIDFEPEINTAIIECVRCRGLFTFDTMHVIGGMEGEEVLNVIDQVCRGPRLRA